MAKRAGLKSQRAYDRYEHGIAAPTVDELDRLLCVVAPDRTLVLRQSAA